MQIEPEFLFGAAIAAAAFLAGVLKLRGYAKRTRSFGRRMAHAPDNLRFTCAMCSGKFTHSRRTLAAWEKGERSFLCKACHTRRNTDKQGPPKAPVITVSKGRSR